MNEASYEVVVIGAGAAGLMTAMIAAERGRRTLLLEKNRKAGVKILMSGGTRCNITQNTDRQGIVQAFGPAGRFLQSALAALGPRELVDFFHQEGCPTKVEPTGKIFPTSDRALDVLKALLQRLDRSGAQLALEEPVTDLRRDGDEFHISTTRRSLRAARVVLATGGQSYPGCGTTGDGYAWAKALGHSIVPPRPALVPLTSTVRWIPPLRGITIPDAQVSVRQPTDTPAAGKPRQATRRRDPSLLDARRGSLLFTHFGLSGPAVLDVSRAVTLHPHPRQLQLVCDLLPSLSEDQCREMLRNQCTRDGRKQLDHLLSAYLPRRLAETVVQLAGLPEQRRGAELARRELMALVETIKHLPVPVAGTLGFKKAEVTAGGVPLDQVDSRNMHSKQVPGLYLVGEILDLDGPIGGYNFQAAFSTGWLAGQSV